VELRRKAAAFALEAVDSQKEQFRRYAGRAAFSGNPHKELPLIGRAP